MRVPERRMNSIPNSPGRDYKRTIVVRVILFDIDGTLLHTGGAGIKAFARAFSSEFGVHQGTEKIKFAGRTDKSLVREFFLRAGIEPSDKNFERFFEAYVFWLRKIIAECEGGACRGVLEFHRQLESHQSLPIIGLLTGNIKRGAEIKLGHYGLWDKFKFGGFADDHEERDKIAAAAMERARKLAGDDLRPEEVVVVGDTPLDIRCARAIGARALAVATGGASLEELAAHKPDWLVKDLSSLTVERVLNGEID